AAQGSGVGEFAQAGALPLVEPEAVEEVPRQRLGDGGERQAVAGEEGAEELEIAEVGGGHDRSPAGGPRFLEAAVAVPVHLHELADLALGEVGGAEELHDQRAEVAVEGAEDGFALGLA